MLQLAMQQTIGISNVKLKIVLMKQKPNLKISREDYLNACWVIKKKIILQSFFRDWSRIADCCKCQLSLLVPSVDSPRNTSLVVAMVLFKRIKNSTARRLISQLDTKIQNVNNQIVVYSLTYVESNQWNPKIFVS